MDYQKIYEEWDSLPDCKMRLPDESFWGKVLPDGNYGINNMVLSDKYRWQDIVLTKSLSEEDAEKLIIYRRWKCQAFYNFDEPEDREQASEMRQMIYDALTPLGSPGFAWRGFGYVLIEEDLTQEDAFAKIAKVLSGVGIEIH